MQKNSFHKKSILNSFTSILLYHSPAVYVPKYNSCSKEWCHSYQAINFILLEKRKIAKCKADSQKPVNACTSVLSAVHTYLFLFEVYFLPTWPFGPGLSYSRYVRLSVCLYVTKVVVFDNDQSIKCFFFLHKIEWVCVVLMILNLEQHEKYMIGSKGTMIITTFLSMII